MEEEIDLRIYIDVLFRRWPIIIGLALAAAVAAGVVSFFLLAPTYEAAAGVVTLKSKAEISLGSGFRSLTEEDMVFSQELASEVIIDRASRRLNSVVGMVHNATIAQQVADELSDILTDEERQLAWLGGRVKGRVLGLDEDEKSDTIQVVASHSDPYKAAAIANAWAQAFEIHVNDIYGQASSAPFADIQKRVDETRLEYDSAQETLLTFLTEDDRVNELQRQIAEEEVIIGKLRSGRRTAISAIVDKEVEVKQRLIGAYLDDEATNRLFAFNKGQEAKRQMLGTWIDAEIANRIAAIKRDRNMRLRLFDTSVAAEIDSMLRVFEHQRDELLRDLEKAYTRKHRLEDLLVEARLMRKQLVKGGEASARSNGLALLAFKSRIFATVSGLPINELNLEMSSIEALNPLVSAVEQIADLDGLIAAMEEELAALEVSIQEQSDAMLKGEGYDFLELLSPERLTIAASQTALVTDTTGVMGTAVISTSLSDFVVQRYNDLFDLGEMARAAEDVATDTPLFAEIQALYPELFTKDDWMLLAESIPEETELGSLAAQMADDLLEMKGWEDVVAYSVLEKPLSQEIVQRENYVRLLQADIVRLNQTKADLQQDRDLAWQAYTTLLAKAQEIDVAAASEDIEVRFASPALPPETPVAPRKLFNVAVAGALGLMLGVFGAFALEWWQGGEMAQAREPED